MRFTINPASHSFWMISSMTETDRKWQSAEVSGLFTSSLWFLETACSCVRDSEKERPYLYCVTECDSSLPSYFAWTVQEPWACHFSGWMHYKHVCMCLPTYSSTYRSLLFTKYFFWHDYTVHFASGKSVFVCAGVCAYSLGEDLQKVLLSTSGAICQWQGRNANQMQSDNTPRSLPLLEQPTEIN